LWPSRPVQEVVAAGCKPRLSVGAKALDDSSRMHPINSAVVLLRTKGPFSKFGKPMITAKNTFAVKHLHHKPPHLTGLDANFKVVDNLPPPSAIAHFMAAPKKKMSTMSLVQ
jgi:hypothetical protein